MKIVESPLEAYALVDNWRRDELKIGLVPTMGALHEGHLSLVERSRQECDVSIATIFVNPTQFGPNEDFARYPRTLEDDCRLLQDLGTDMVFTPTREALYPPGFSCHIEPPSAAIPLEGVCRPGHFRGVTTIVLKLFQILPATVAYFGQKDYQQLTVIRRMVEDLNVPIRIEGCETIREPDGLAKSSRNRYLSVEERARALALWKALEQAEQLVRGGEKNVAAIENAMHQALYDSGADRVEYARLVDPQTLETLLQVPDQVVALIAAYVGKTRLIDNRVIEC